MLRNHRVRAVGLLSTMQGGYNVQPLIDALDLEAPLAEAAVAGLKNILLMFDSLHDVKEKMKAGNACA